jgi:hypothetical protein
MPEYSTGNRDDGSQPVIRFLLDDTSPLSAQWLLGYFKEALARGNRFVSGQTVQVGWMICKLKAVDDGILELWEPDFDAFPIRWIKGVNTTMRHLFLQRSICDELKCEPDFPSLQAGIVLRGFAGSEDFTLTREAPQDAHSGWSLMEFNYQGQQAEYQSLYQLALWNIRIVPFLALPSGTIVHRRAAGFDVSCGTTRATSRECKLLQRLANATPV